MSASASGRGDGAGRADANLAVCTTAGLVKLRATAARFSPGVFDNSIGACPGSQPQHAASSVPQKVARLVSLGAFPISLHWPPLDRRAGVGPFPRAVGFPPEGNLPRVPSTNRKAPGPGLCAELLRDALLGGDGGLGGLLILRAGSFFRPVLGGPPGEAGSAL